MRELHYSVELKAWSGEYVGLCAEFPSLSWLASTHYEALNGIKNLVKNIIDDLKNEGIEL